jgi:hypothetical protein
MSDNQNDNKKWKGIKKLSAGNVKGRIKAVDLLIGNFRTFVDSFALLKQLANKRQPSEVRIRVATKMRDAPLKVRERSELMIILSQNASKELLAYLRLLSMSSMINYKLLQNINPSKTINDALLLQTKLLQDITRAEMSKVFTIT